MSELADRFLAAYNKLDRVMRERLPKESFVAHRNLLAEMRRKSSISDADYVTLFKFAELRNSIVHDSDQNANPIAEPHEYVVVQYERLADTLLHPPEALSRAIEAQRIYKTTLEASAVEVMRVMNDRVYTHVPVIEEDRLVGVFSENTIFSHLAKHGSLSIDSNTLIRDFAEFLPVDSHVSECFEFVSHDTSLADVATLFQEKLREQKRLAVVFITRQGRKTEPILGMMTAWDIAGQ